MILWLFDHRARLALWAVMLVAAVVVLASCGDDGGLYQGGNDDSPRWR